MIENLIVGSGFSALSAKLALGDTASVSILTHTSIKKNDFFLKRSREFEVNKLFQNHASSYTNFSNLDKNIHLYDRMIIGGHSNIWGGFIDKSSLCVEILESLKKNGVVLTPIYSNEVHYSASSQSVYQLRDLNNKILDVKNFLAPEYDGHMVSLAFNGNFYKLGYIDNFSGSLKFLIAKNVILCMGLVQTLNFIVNNYNNNYVFSLSEHSHNISFKFSNKEKNSDGFVMHYSLLSAIRHFFGIKHRLKILDPIFNLFPIYVRQKFSDTLNHIKFKFVTGSKGGFLIKKISGPNIFGTSIHYFNLQVNNMPLDDFFKGFFPGIILLGAGSIKKCIPGPISNYILKDAFEKLSRSIN
jgi:hypothetical protein